MRLEVTWNGERSELELSDGELTWGGGADDELQFPGLPPSLARATVKGERLVVRPRCALRVGGVLSPPGVERLVLPGEAIELDEAVQVSVPAAATPERAAVATAVVLSELLQGQQRRPPQRTRAAYFDCVAGPNLGAQLAVAYVDCVLGRGSEAQLRLADPAVSRRQARLVREGKAWVLSPLPSTNGVFVNGARLHGPRPLAAGDVVEVGRSLLRFQPEAKSEEERTVVAAAPTPTPVAAVAPAPAPVEAAPAEPEPEVTSTERLRDPDRRAGGWGSWVWVAVPFSLAVLSAAITWALLRTL